MDKVAIIDELEIKLGKYEKKFGPLVEERGVKNWKNLFRKPTLQDWIILFMLFMAILMGITYGVETKECRRIVSNIEEICFEYNSPINGIPQSPGLQLNLTGIILNGGNLSDNG